MSFQKFLKQVAYYVIAALATALFVGIGIIVIVVIVKVAPLVLGAGILYLGGMALWRVSSIFKKAKFD